MGPVLVDFSCKRSKNSCADPLGSIHSITIKNFCNVKSFRKANISLFFVKVKGNAKVIHILLIKRISYFEDKITELQTAQLLKTSNKKT